MNVLNFGSSGVVCFFSISITNFYNHSLPNTLWVGVWTHKHLLRRPLGGPNTYKPKVWLGNFGRARGFSKKMMVTLPETNIAPENGWLEYYFPIGMAYFQVRTVSFSEGKPPTRSFLTDGQIPWISTVKTWNLGDVRLITEKRQTWRNDKVAVRKTSLAGNLAFFFLLGTGGCNKKKIANYIIGISSAEKNNEILGFLEAELQISISWLMSCQGFGESLLTLQLEAMSKRPLEEEVPIVERVSLCWFLNFFMKNTQHFFYSFHLIWFLQKQINIDE